MIKQLEKLSLTLNLFSMIPCRNAFSSLHPKLWFAFPNEKNIWNIFFHPFGKFVPRKLLLPPPPKFIKYNLKTCLSSGGKRFSKERIFFLSPITCKRWRWLYLVLIWNCEPGVINTLDSRSIINSTPNSLSFNLTKQ